VNPDIFRAYDIRGKSGTELTAEACWQAGQAFADWLPSEGPVAVGHDMRVDSRQFAEAVIEGLRLQGREVWDIGLVTTDMIYFTVGKFSLAGGAMVTASHSPGEYNGVKLCREEAKPVGIDTGLAEIRDAALAGNLEPAPEKGKIVNRDVRQEWVAHVLSFVNPSNWPAYKIAIDAGNGMVGEIAPLLAEHLPLKITPLYYELDGTYPNHVANPMEPENLVDLQKAIRENGLDFGIAFDGDGDRAVLLDETGEALSGSITTALLATYFLAKQPHATILYNAICGRIVPETIEENGGRGIRTKVGHSFVKADMRAHDAVFAGEHSGHYFFKDNWSADSGLIAALIVIQILADSGLKLSQLAQKYKKYEAIPETNFSVEDKEGVINQLKTVLSDGDQDELDGLTVNYPDGWCNVRPSSNDPFLRLNAEAKNRQTLDDMVARVIAVIKQF
jgi:phosphomannomutase